MKNPKNFCEKPQPFCHLKCLIIERIIYRENTLQIRRIIIMKVSKQNMEITEFVRKVMGRIEAMRKHLNVGSKQDIEEYYKKHGTYSGIEDWVSTRI